MRLAVVASLLAVAACGAAPVALPGVDLILLPPVGAAAAGAPETPDFPPPEEPAEEEPTPAADAEAEAQAEEHAAMAESDSESDPGSDPVPDPVPAPAPVPVPVPAPAPLRTHRTVAGAGFSYVIPASWRELDAASLGVPTLVTAQRAPAPIDGFVTNVSVAVERFDGDGLAYGEIHATAIAAGDALRDVWPATLRGRPALDVEGIWTNLGGTPYLTLQRYAVDGRFGYVITCAAALTAYEAERTVCEDVLATFDVLD